MSKEYVTVSRSILRFADFAFCLLGGYLMKLSIDHQSYMVAIVAILSLRAVPSLGFYLDANQPKPGRYDDYDIK